MINTQVSYQKIVIQNYGEPIVQSILNNPTTDNVTNLINDLVEKYSKLGDSDILSSTLFYIGASLKETDFASYYIFLLAFYNDDYEAIKEADINIQDSVEIADELRVRENGLS